MSDIFCMFLKSFLDVRMFGSNLCYSCLPHFGG